MSNYIQAELFGPKDTLPTGNVEKIIKGSEFDTEFGLIQTSIATKADTNSPTFTGTPIAPTAAAGNNTTQLATTAFVTGAVGALGTMSTQNKTAVDITGGTIAGAAISGGSVTGITDLLVADGGTGLSTLTANNVILGNGTSTPLFVAPSTTGNVLTSNGTTWTSEANNKLTSMTAQATTSGTSKDFTDIPSWVKRITVIFNGVSSTGNNNLLVQLGTSGGIETTGYSSLVASDRGSEYTSTTGLLVAPSGSTTNNSKLSGTITILLVSGTTFVSSTCCADLDGNERSFTGGGNKTLASALTQLKVLSTVAFDAGSVNVMYE
jgi:hypothetical protein